MASAAAVLSASAAWTSAETRANPGIEIAAVGAGCGVGNTPADAARPGRPAPVTAAEAALAPAGSTCACAFDEPAAGVFAGWSETTPPEVLGASAVGASLCEQGGTGEAMPNEKCAAVAPDPDSPTRTVPVPRKEPEGVDCGADSEGVPAGVTRPRRRPAAALATVGGGGTWADFAAGVFAGSIPRASVAFVATAAGVKLYMIGRV